MNDELIQEIIDRLDKLGELGGEGFEILLRQVYLDAALNVFWAGFFVIVILVFRKLLRNCGHLGGNAIWTFETGRTFSEPEVDHFNRNTALGVLYGSLGVSVALFVGFIVSALLRLINPEFWAIKYIISVL